MINDKEFLKFEDGFFKPYFEKFIEFKRGKGEKVASSTLIRFRKLNNSLNQYQTDQISEKMIRELLTPHNGLSEIERQYMASNLRQFCSFLMLLGVNAAAVPLKYMKITRYLIWPKLKRLLHKPAKNVYRMQSLQRFNIFTSLDVKLGYIDSEKY